MATIRPSLVTSLVTLPTELIEFIVFQDTLSYRDVVNIQLCCKTLYYVVHSNDKLLKTKFLQRWPKCLLSEQHKKVRIWRALYMLRESWRSKVSQAILRTTELLLDKGETPKCILPAVFKELSLYDEDFLVDCIIDALFEVTTPVQDPLLSQQYYALKLLQRLNSEWLKRRWEKRIANSGGIANVRLEDGIRFVGQHINAEKDYRSVDPGQFFDKLVGEVIKKVAAEDSAFAAKISSTVQSTARVTLGVWTPRQNSVIMTQVKYAVLEEFLGDICGEFGQLTEGTLEQMLSTPNRFRTKPLAILTMVCVAHRMGVDCRVLLYSPFFPGFAFKFFGFDDSNNTKTWAYLNTSMAFDFDYGRTAESRDFITPRDLPAVLSHYAEVTIPQNRDLGIVETKAYLDPSNMNYTRVLIMNYMDNHINLDEVKILLQKIRTGVGRHFYHMLNRETFSDMDELKLPPTAIVKDRNSARYSDVKYSVGMIMYQVRYGYDCVITGWTPVCEQDEEWIVQMGVDTLPLGPNQPFYNVLVADGSHRYAAQENLQYHNSPVAISNQSVGRYMKAFKRTHYIMNHAVAREYPGDTELTTSVARQRYPNVTG